MLSLVMQKDILSFLQCHLLEMHISSSLSWKEDEPPGDFY